MQGSPLPEADEWAMPERRERDVMRDMPPRKRDSGDDDFRLPTARGILTKEEIQALLRPDLPTINDAEAPAPGAGVPAEKTFETIETTSAEDGRRLAARLSLLFAQSTGLKAGFRFHSAAQIGDLEAALAGGQGSPGGAFICFGRSGDTVTTVLEVPGPLGNTLVSHACGGGADTGGTSAPRMLSAIDCALIEQLLSPLRAAFGPDTSFIGVETDSRFVGSLVPGQSGEQIKLQAVMSDEAVDLRLYRVSGHAERVSRDAAVPAARKRAVSAVLTARLASLSVPVSRLSGLKPGDTLLLGLPSDQPVELLSGGREGVKAFEGDIGRKGNNMAIRIRRTFNS